VTPKITVDRTPSDESIAQLSMTSPGSSSSPRSEFQKVLSEQMTKFGSEKKNGNVLGGPGVVW
jgi:hypothetical protein